MTYKLNHEIRETQASVVLAFPDGEKQHYPNGTSDTTAVHEHKYVVSALCAGDDAVEVELVE